MERSELRQREGFGSRAQINPEVLHGVAQPFGVAARFPVIDQGFSFLRKGGPHKSPEGFFVFDSEIFYF